jgi:hypothetical protein
MTSRVLVKAVARGAVRRLLRAAVFAAVVAAPLVARAQEVNLSRLDDEPANRVHVRTGAEYGFVAGVGYARTVSLLDRRLLLTGDVTVPFGGVDASDYRVRTGALVPIVGARRWRLAGSVAPTVRGTQNAAGTMTSLGTDLGVQGGFYARHWFVAGETGFDWSMTTHITHSDEYRELVYPGARDGWYAMSGGIIRYGVQAGASFGRHDLVLRAGQMIEIGGETPMLPFYGTLALDTRW